MTLSLEGVQVMNSISGFWKDQLSVKEFTLLYSDCNTEIVPEEKSKIIADLDESLPGYDVQQYFGSQPNIFRDYDHLTVARDSISGNTVGLLGSKWFSSPELTYLYLWTAMIGEGARKSGLLTSIFLWQLSKVVQEKTTPPLIATKTYNPIVYKAMNALHHLIAGSRFYPAINGSNQDPELVGRAKQVVALLCPKLEVKYDTGVVVGGQGVLAPNFFPELPSSRDPIVDSYFDSNLTRNDQILMIVDIPPSSYQAVDVLLRNAAMTNFASLRSLAHVS
jgi:hypothetical protein